MAERQEPNLDRVRDAMREHDEHAGDEDEREALERGGERDDERDGEGDGDGDG